MSCNLYRYPKFYNHDTETLGTYGTVQDFLLIILIYRRFFLFIIIGNVYQSIAIVLSLDIPEKLLMLKDISTKLQINFILFKQLFLKAKLFHN